MKRLLLILTVILVSCNSSEKVVQEKDSKEYIPTVDFLGQLKEEQLQFVKDNYAWPQGTVLVLNYSQPRSQCHFDNFRITRSSRKWWKKFYSKVDMLEVSNVFVIADSNKVQKHINNTIYFADKDDFLLRNFFSRKKSCYGVMVLNEAGKYLQYNGHYSERQVDRFIEILRL